MRGVTENVLTALNEAEVRYLVVGGLAVVLHGHLRTTMDLDLVIQLETDNLHKALRALVVMKAAKKFSRDSATLSSKQHPNLDLHLLEMGLRLTPAERLQWLEDTVEELLPWVGLAARASKEERQRSSHFDVPGIKTRATTEDLLDAIQESRSRKK